jgi:glycerophosphoryl diester phosphodiesterase
MSVAFKTPMVFAHRGASLYAPENTLAAFNLAIEQGANGVELDVKLSADGVPVVIHDQTVDRTTDGHGKVNELTLDQLKSLDAGKLFADKYHVVQIPTLDEVLEEISKRTIVNIELTNYASPSDDLVPRVAKIVQAHALENQILFSSFLGRNLRIAKQLCPQVPVAILCLPGLPGIFNRSGLLTNTSPEIVHPYLLDVTPSLVDREHKRGRRVHTWTVNAEKDLEFVLSCGVDGVFTDDPLTALRVMERR